MRLRFFSRGPVAAALLVAAAGCGAEGPRQAAPMALETCWIQGVREPVKCGTLVVPEDRGATAAPGANEDAGDPRTHIALRFVVIPALDASPAPDPVFVLAGGPGQSAIDIAGFALALGSDFRERRDIVLVDQRGTGRSNGLFCDPPDRAQPLADRLDTSFRPEDVIACRDGLDADLTQYTTRAAAEDLDEVRRALGYARVNLWGTSYGTRLALAYMRSFGAHARAALLDGVAPTSLVLPRDIARDGHDALLGAFDACERDPACDAAFPRLRARFFALVADLTAAPERVELRHPTTGATEPVTITRELVASMARGILYEPSLRASLPHALDRAAERDFGPLITLGLTLSGSVERTMSTGLFLSVVCSEDAARTNADEIEAAAAGTFVGPAAGRNILDACAVWPKAARRADPEDARATQAIDVPVLLMSGKLDPVTPPRWGDEAAKALSRSRHVVFANMGHNTMTSPCAGRIAARFIADGDADSIDQTCAEEIPPFPFFLPFAGNP